MRGGPWAPGVGQLSARVHGAHADRGAPPAVQRTVLADEESLLNRLGDIRQVSGVNAGPWEPLAFGHGRYLIEGAQGCPGGQLTIPASLPGLACPSAT